MRKVSSPSNPAIKLALKALRFNTDLIAVEGAKLFYEAVRSLGGPEMVFVCDEANLPSEGEYDGVSFVVSPSLMRELSSLTTKAPIMAFFKKPDSKPLSEIIKNAAAVVVLDRLQDPGNIGTIVRTAEAMGADAVITLKGSCSAYNHKAIRASMGSSFRLPLFCGAKLNDLIKLLKENNFANIALDAGGSALERYDFGKKCAFFLGQEGQGLANEILKECDTALAISMQRQVESLNVASSAAICLYQWQIKQSFSLKTKANV